MTFKTTDQKDNSTSFTFTFMLVVCFFVSLFVCLLACILILGVWTHPKKLRPMKHGTTWLWFNRWEMAAYRILALDQKNRNKSRPLLWTKIRHFSSGEFFSKYRKKLLYFEWSPPWHVGWRLSGEGCHWEYDGKNGEFENIDFRFPWPSDTSEMGFGHDVPFLNYSDRLPRPSDLCQPDRVRWG